MFRADVPSGDGARETESARKRVARSKRIRDFNDEAHTRDDDDEPTLRRLGDLPRIVSHYACVARYTRAIRQRRISLNRVLAEYVRLLKQHREARFNLVWRARHRALMNKAGRLYRDSFEVQRAATLGGSVTLGTGIFITRMREQARKRKRLFFNSRIRLFEGLVLAGRRTCMCARAHMRVKFFELFMLMHNHAVQHYNVCRQLYCEVERRADLDL